MSTEQTAESGGLPMGTAVRVSELSVSGDPDIDRSAARPGAAYDVFCYSAPGEGDDPQGRPYYLLDDDGSCGGSHWAYPEHVEVVMTVGQKAARKPPPLKDVLVGVSGALSSMYDPIEVSVVERVGDDALEVYGETDEGLYVAFRVRIDRIEEADCG